MHSCGAEESVTACAMCIVPPATSRARTCAVKLLSPVVRYRTCFSLLLYDVCLVLLKFGGRIIDLGYFRYSRVSVTQL